jgi:carbamoyl-phosphate synthase large subunit
MQGNLDRNRNLHVIECNPRFGGASTLGIAVGLDSLHWSLLELSGADLRLWPFHRAPTQVRQVRVPHDLHFNDPGL